MSAQVLPEQDAAATVELMAIRLLGRREHSRHELRHKLSSRHADCDVVEAVLDDLEQRGLLSDERFIEGYLDQRARKGYGPLRIRAELGERGIAAEIAAHHLGDGRNDWPALMTEVAVRKFGETTAADPRALAKRGRFLEQRGFPVSLIRRYLDQVRAF